jgi:epoxyqueuosine reductase QueG
MTGDEARALAVQIGYDAAGIAPPQVGRTPAWARSVLVGLHATLDEAFDYEMYIAYDGRRKWYKPIYTALEALSFRLAEALRAAGQRAEALTYEHSIDLLDLKRAAVEAGLGVLGKNNLVVSKRYGPRVRFGAVFTDADWPANGPPLDYFCPSCTLCWNACPTRALGPAGFQRAACIAEYNPTPALAALQDRLERRPSPCTRLQCTACITACPIGAKLPAEFYRDMKTE